MALFSHHVLEEGKTVWNASLAMTDFRRNSNSYYKLQVQKAARRPAGVAHGRMCHKMPDRNLIFLPFQILVPDRFGRTYLFRSWGRVGTTQGGKKVIKKNVLFAYRSDTVFPRRVFPNAVQVEDVSNIAEAKAIFNTLFTEKTGGNVFGRTPYAKVGRWQRG